MTPDEIEKIANERYKLTKGMCRREREELLRLKKIFIEREILKWFKNHVTIIKEEKRDLSNFNVFGE